MISRSVFRRHLERLTRLILLAHRVEGDALAHIATLWMKCRRGRWKYLLEILHRRGFRLVFEVQWVIRSRYQASARRSLVVPSRLRAVSAQLAQFLAHLLDAFLISELLLAVFMHDIRNVISPKLALLREEWRNFPWLLLLIILGLSRRLNLLLILLLTTKLGHKLHQHLYPLIRLLLQLGNLQIMMFD